jgi:hypothetical protein
MDPHGKVHSRNLFHGIERLADRAAATIPAVDRETAAALTEPFQGEAMDVREIADVDVVPDTGAVGSVVIVAKYGNEKRLPNAASQATDFAPCPARPAASAPAALKQRNIAYLMECASAVSRSIASAMSFDLPKGDTGDRTASSLQASAPPYTAAVDENTKCWTPSLMQASITLRASAVLLR